MGSQAIRRHRRWAATSGGLARIGSSEARHIALLLLLGTVFAFGGSSRGDILSLVILRPLSFLALGYAILTLPKGAVRWSAMPLVLLLALTALIGMQLVPLPPGIWTSLPGRDLVARLDAHLGFEGLWRPLTLSPSRTLNSLFAMGVPLAVALLLTGTSGRHRHRIVVALLVAGAASAVLGILQLLGPANGPFYTYRITNFGGVPGLFANRNHHAVYLAALIPLIGYQMLRARSEPPSGRRSLVTTLLANFAIALLLVILITGSRAGAALAVVTAAATSALWFIADRNRRSRGTRAARFALPLSLLGLAAIGLAAFVQSRSESIYRIMDTSLDAEGRILLVPQLWSMVEAYFPAGTGFGSFYLAYYVIEPHDQLRTTYLNQAHNDLLQVPIEGGLPAALLLAAGLAWFVVAGFRCWRRFRLAADGTHGPVPSGIFAWVSLACLLAGSIVDYPLRTPALMAVAVVLAHFVSIGTGPQGADRTVN